jgi:sigma-B regulation protein RsbU (phosphoserine phosphatase)
MEKLDLSDIRNQLYERKERIEKALPRFDDDLNLISLLKEVDSALERINTGTYGLCEVCKDPIEPERLKSDPLMRFCIDHLTTEQQHLLEEDFELASTIQQGLLPKNNLLLSGWEINYKYVPAGVVSGDYCDVLEDNKNNLFFIIGDVSGKGFPASMLMTHMHALFHSLLPFDLPVNELIERVNRLFCESTLSNHYATLVCIKTDKNGNIELCNAGHFHPLIFRNGEVEKIDSTGFPLGLFCNGQYSVFTAQLKKGDIIFLYTDGLIETRKDDEEFGIERTINILNTNNQLKGHEIIECLLNELNSFSPRPERIDDLTVLVIKRSF